MTIQLEGACLPSSQDLHITQVFAACIDAIGQSNEDIKAGVTPYFLPADSVGLDSCDQVIVLLCDGLGLNILDSHLAHAPNIRSHRDSVKTAFTVIPSTTAAAISSFSTGKRPGETQMVGYSVLYDGHAMNLLAFEGGPQPQKWQTQKTFFEKLRVSGIDSAIVLPPSFAGSGLTRAALRGARHVGAVSWEERIDRAINQVVEGTPIVYLYWSDVDHAGHEYGAGSDEWVVALEQFDAGLGKLIRRVEGLNRRNKRIRMLLTADHGMVNVQPDTLTDLAHHPDLAQDVDAIAGETRCVHLHASRGRGEQVLQRWQEILSDQAWVVPAKHLSEILGDGPGIQHVGDAMVLSKERHGIVDSRIQTAQSRALIGIHGSITEDEMLIPVVRLV